MSLSERDLLLEAYASAGGDMDVLRDETIGHIAAEGHRILSMRAVEGLAVDARETGDGISARVTVKSGVKILHPVHLCFGIVHEKGVQRIIMDIRFERNASAHFIAHCLFPSAEKVRHIMDATVILGEGAEMRYNEVHFHGPHGGVEVVPKAVVTLGADSRYFADFSLLTGHVGKLNLDYHVTAHENAVAELTARVFGHAHDTITIKDTLILAGENARGLIKTRVALEDNACADVTGITEGNAAGARGHVDCMEIVKDNAVAHATPIVSVKHPLAKVTHEAAIGSVDKRQMETLMAHGLTPEEATDIIVRGILK